MSGKRAKITVLGEPFNLAKELDVSGCFHIEFEWGGFRSRIRVSERDGRLLINGDDCLEMRPEASNSFSVGFVKR